MESGWKCSSNAALCQNPMECRECSLNENCHSCTNKFTEACAICRNRHGLAEVLNNILIALGQYREIGTIDDFKALDYQRKRYENEVYDYCGEYGTEERELKPQMERLREYEKIGTIKECQRAVEKQKAKKPVRNSKMAMWKYTCSVCGEPLIQQGYKYNYCDMCGNRIDWSDAE